MDIVGNTEVLDQHSLEETKHEVIRTNEEVFKKSLSIKAFASNTSRTIKYASEMIQRSYSPLLLKYKNSIFRKNVDKSTQEIPDKANSNIIRKIKSHENRPRAQSFRIASPRRSHRDSRHNYTKNLIQKNSNPIRPSSIFRTQKNNHNQYSPQVQSDSNINLVNNEIEDSNSLQLPSSVPLSEETPEESLEINNRIDYLLELDTHTKLRKAIFFFLTYLFSCAFLILMVTSDFSYKNIFYLQYTFLLYYFGENLHKYCKDAYSEWRKQENAFSLLDILLIIIIGIMIDAQLSGYSTTSKWIALPLTIVTIIYLQVSKSRLSVKLYETAARLAFTIQILMIMQKIEGNLALPWMFTLGPIWINLMIIVFYWVLVCLILILMCLLGSFDINIYPNMTRSQQILGFFWYFLFCGLGVVSCFILAGAVLAVDYGYTKTLMMTSLHIGVCLAFFNLLFTLFFYRKLHNFLRKFLIEDEDYRVGLGLKKDEIPMKIKTEKKKMYLVMLSPTYFLPLKKSFLIKDKKNLDYIKQAIMKFRSHRQGKDINYHLNKFVSNSASENDPLTKQDKNLRKKEYKPSKFKQRPYSPLQKSNPTQELNDKDLYFSDGEIDYYEDRELKAFNNKQHSVPLCYICCEKAANAVMMDCGHGGICYTCAINYIKQKRQCMECRRPSIHILKVSYISSNLRNVIKAEEVSEVMPFE